MSEVSKHKIWTQVTTQNCSIEIEAESAEAALSAFNDWAMDDLYRLGMVIESEDSYIQHTTVEKVSLFNGKILSGGVLTQEMVEEAAAIAIKRGWGRGKKDE